MSTDQDALVAMEVTLRKMRQEGINPANAEEFLICLKGLLENPVLGKSFMSFLGVLASMPEVVEGARQIPFGEKALKMFCHYVSRKYG